MIIAIGSGKGGTGKTTIATSLAISLARNDMALQFLDCDVEEPNANLFLKASINDKLPVEVMTPQIDDALCTHCKKCAEFCRFHALVVYPDKVLTFPEMCHSCTGCIRVCPVDAVGASSREIGFIEKGEAHGIEFAHGKINIGEARATPIIAMLHSFIDPKRITILDAPPGTSCPFVESLKESDVCALVTEPTPFGLHDLKLAVEVTKKLEIPMGVIINRCDMGDDRVERYCIEEGIEILMMIEHHRDIAEAYSKGVPLVDAKPEYQRSFVDLYDKLKKISEKKT